MCSTMYNGHVVQDKMSSMVGALAACLIVTAQRFAHLMLIQHAATSKQYGHVSSEC